MPSRAFQGSSSVSLATSLHSPVAPAVPLATGAAGTLSRRIQSIDALRGFVMIVMLLGVLYHAAYFVWGPNQGVVFGVDSLASVWVWYLALIVPLYFPTAWFARLKARRRDIAWLKYF